MTHEIVIFTRTYDLLSWLITQTEKFPLPRRVVGTKRLQDAALDFQERILEANAVPSGRARLVKIYEGDAALAKLQLYLRLAHRFQWLTDGQYAHVSQKVTELGKLLGGWIKSNRSAPPK